MKNQSRFAPALALAMALTFILFTSYLPNPSITVAAQDVSPAALTELSIDNASSDSASLSCAFGLSDTTQTPRGQVQFSWANKLTPSSYPATLRVVTIGLNRLGPTGQEVLGFGDVFSVQLDNDVALVEAGLGGRASRCNLGDADSVGDQHPFIGVD